MAEPKRQLERTIKIQPTMAAHQAVMHIALGALRTTMEDLAAMHDNKAGEWLDDLEARLIKEAKGTIAVGTSIEVEAESLKGGIDTLQAMIDIVRHNLTHEG